jgi:hypothetical protein
MIEDQIIRECKDIINRQSFLALQEMYAELQASDWSEQPPLDWPYILQKVYIHACLKKKPEIAAWLESLFQTLVDPINQIAYRSTFAYGRHLLRK